MVLRIFITADNHIGCHERNDLRKNDASDTFEEALSIASTKNCDLILQCGDLFDKNRPSKQAMYSVMKTLRRHCLGDKPVEFEVLNHDRFSWEDNDEEFNHPNFEDPNINVGLPVFAISGNHDDAGSSEFGASLSPLDTLSMSGLINHFGRVPNNTQIVVTPILIQKGEVKVAIYGIANVRDERLYRTFRDGNVKFRRPRDDPDSWYNILILHQNHVSRELKNFNPEQLVPTFINLVLWGHEHECRIDPVLNEHRGFHVMQPGSTVATSYHASEAGPKYVSVVTIDENKSLETEKFLLKTVRPYALKTVNLQEDAPQILTNTPDSRILVTNWLIEQVEQLIRDAQELWEHSHDASDQPMLPLVRLRVYYSGGYEVENSVRFSSRFEGRVANPEEILHLTRLRQTEDKATPFGRGHLVDDAMRDESTANISVEQVTKLMQEHLEKEKPTVLLEKDMREAMSRFVEKEENDALVTGIGLSIEKKRAQWKESISGDDQESIFSEKDSELSNSEEIHERAFIGESPQEEDVPSAEAFMDIESLGVESEQVNARARSQRSNSNNASQKKSTKSARKSSSNGSSSRTRKRSALFQIPESEVVEQAYDSDSSDMFSLAD